MGMYDNPPYYLSAYGLAVKHGFRGTESEWLVSNTAYGLACGQGFRGTLAEWLASLKGEPGRTAYEAAREAGYEGSEADFGAMLATMAAYIAQGAAAIEDGSITGEKLAEEAVHTANLAAGAVTGEKLAEGAVQGTMLADGSVSEEKIRNGAVTRAKIEDGEVTRPKLANEAVSADKLAPLAVTGEKIALNAVSVRHTVSIETNWTGESAPYTQTVSVAGLRDDSKVIADVALSETYADAEAELEEWAKIRKITTGNDEITVYAAEKTMRTISVKLLEVRK